MPLGNIKFASDKYSFIVCSLFKKNGRWLNLVYYIHTLLQVTQYTLKLFHEGIAILVREEIRMYY